MIIYLNAMQFICLISIFYANGDTYNDGKRKTTRRNEEKKREVQTLDRKVKLNFLFLLLDFQISACLRPRFASKFSGINMLRT